MKRKRLAIYSEGGDQEEPSGERMFPADSPSGEVPALAEIVERQAREILAKLPAVSEWPRLPPLGSRSEWIEARELELPGMDLSREDAEAVAAALDWLHRADQCVQIGDPLPAFVALTGWELRFLFLSLQEIVARRVAALRGGRLGGAPRVLDGGALAFARDAARDRFRRMPRTYSRADAAKAIAARLSEKHPAGLGVQIAPETLARYLPTRDELRAERDAT